MSDLSTVRPRRSVRDEVYEELRAAILDATLEPGEVVSDEAIMHWLNVSRPPVREALNRLADEGLLELQPNRRTRVASLDLRDINEALFVTGVLHEACVRSTVGALDARARADLVRFQEEVREAADRDDRQSLGPAVGEFFLTFERASGNAVMVTTVEAQTVRLLRFLTPRQGLLPMSVIAATIDEIASAALEGDADRAGDAVHGLYSPTRDNFIELYRDM